MQLVAFHLPTALGHLPQPLRCLLVLPGPVRQAAPDTHTPSKIAPRSDKAR